jgi:hypothetical protein
MEGGDTVNPFTATRLSGYAIDKGFESETERLEMILNVPGWGQEALEKWLDEDGTRAGLEAILATKRFVRRLTKEDL